MIAIHTKSGSFAPVWVNFCRTRRIEYKAVDCFASDIMEQLRGCRALLWHWEHHDNTAALFARQLIASIEKMGLSIFPSSATCWHYDDKIGQKYLLEAIGAQLIPTHVFFDRDTALRWIEGTSFPKVWKLRGGAGSENVRLVRSADQARALVRRSFGKGWTHSRLSNLRERIWHFRRDRSFVSLVNIGRGLARAIIPHETHRNLPIQRGYAYFQDFIPDNRFDIRVVTIGERSFAIKRHAREGDFRASGSGRISYDVQDIPLECVEASFKIAAALSTQSIAYDFVFQEGRFLLVEISYAFSVPGYTRCAGYWDRELNWHQKPVLPEEFIIEDLIDEIHSI